MGIDVEDYYRRYGPQVLRRVEKRRSVLVCSSQPREGKRKNEPKDTRRRLAPSMIDQGGYSCTCSLMTNEILSSTL